MDKHKCKLCLKRFINGRALGGHMRSHMLNLYVPPKDQLSENTQSARSENEDEEDQNEDEKDILSYELRENPKRSIRLVDPEFSFPIDAGSAGSVVVQDSASETESSKNLIRRRSKRIRKSPILDHQWQLRAQQQTKKSSKSGKLSKTESEPVSSISDTTPEENVAYCLMMLSRDKWKRDEIEDDDEEYEVETEKYGAYIDADESYSDSDNEHDLKIQKSTRARAKYRCETCNKVFKSYQALGGHRASHKKIKLNQNQNNATQDVLMAETENVTNSIIVEEKIHECPVCYRVFSSGQALGGHKRSHVTGSSSSTIPIVAPVKPVAKHGENLIHLDLNLPAPIDDDDFSQIELSAVSDAEFVNSMKR